MAATVGRLSHGPTTAGNTHFSPDAFRYTEHAGLLKADEPCGLLLFLHSSLLEILPGRLALFCLFVKLCEAHLALVRLLQLLFLVDGLLVVFWLDLQPLRHLRDGNLLVDAVAGGGTDAAVGLCLLRCFLHVAPHHLLNTTVFIKSDHKVALGTDAIHLGGIPLPISGPHCLAASAYCPGRRCIAGKRCSLLSCPDLLRNLRRQEGRDRRRLRLHHHRRSLPTSSRWC
mmetsp:Transcript_17087/g.51066  ORF Transcript_17087/g.51066 Transcript_17087/m.51066 type:complete len:228 (+) Transcript_17087:217-900(+)